MRQTVRGTSTYVVAKPAISSQRNFLDRALTLLDTRLQSFPQPQSPHSQRIYGDSEAVEQLLPILDLFTFLALVVLKNQLAIVRRERLEAASQAGEPAFVIVFRHVNVGRSADFREGRLLPLPAFIDLE